MHVFCSILPGYPEMYGSVGRFALAAELHITRWSFLLAWLAVLASVGYMDIFIHVCLIGWAGSDGILSNAGRWVSCKHQQE